MTTRYLVTAAGPITPGGRPCAPGEIVTGLDESAAARYVETRQLLPLDEPAPGPAPTTASSTAPADPASVDGPPEGQEPNDDAPPPAADPAPTAPKAATRRRKSQSTKDS